MNLKMKIGISLITVLLFGLSFIQIFSQHALAFLTTTSEDTLLSLGMITDLKSLTDASHAIPVLGKVSDSSISSLNKAFNYLSLANALIIAQIIILNLSQSLLFKTIGIFCITGLFFNKTNQLAYKCLILILMISPGIAIFTNVIEYVSNEAKLNLGTNLKDELKRSKDKFQLKRKNLNNSIGFKRAQQLKNAELKGKKHIGILKKIEDDIEDTASKTVLDIDQGLSEGGDIIQVIGKKIDELIINLMVTLIIVFFILPLLYYYIIKLTLSRLILNQKTIV